MKMDHFKSVYRILSFLKKSEKCDEFDDEHFTNSYFRMEERQWALTLERLIDDGHVKGVSVTTGADGYTAISLHSPRITTAGLEYLEENSMMKKAAKIAKGIIDVVT